MIWKNVRDYLVIKRYYHIHGKCIERCSKMIMLLYLSRGGVMLDFDSSLFLLSSMIIYLKIGIYEKM